MKICLAWLVSIKNRWFAAVWDSAAAEERAQDPVLQLVTPMSWVVGSRGTRSQQRSWEENPGLGAMVR